jgi:small GTP-binding protein
MRTLNLSDAKVILVGDPSVGKTSIVEQYHSQKFEANGEPTIGASFISKSVATPLGEVQIHIWDTAGQERYRSIIPMYSRNAVAALLVVDVSNLHSYESIEMWLSLVRANCAANCRVYCVANKTDLEPVIPVRELEERCRELGHPLFKTCAMEYDTIAPLFETVAEDILRFSRPSVAARGAALEGEKRGGCC